MPYSQAYVSCGGPAQGMTIGMQNLLRAIKECPPIPGVRYPLGSGFNVRYMQNTTAYSLHACGRAHDIMVTDETGGSVFANMLMNIGPAIGLQEVIWLRKRWTLAAGWVDLASNIAPHTDHVHWSITPDAGANLTVDQAHDAIYPYLCLFQAYVGPSPLPGAGSPPAAVYPSLPPGSTDPVLTGLTYEANINGCGSVIVAGAVTDLDRIGQPINVSIYVDGLFAGTAATDPATRVFAIEIVNLSIGSHSTELRADNPPGSEVILSTGSVAVPDCDPSSDQINGVTAVLNYATQAEIDALSQCELKLGCGEYDISILELGGRSTYCVPGGYTSFKFNRVLDDVSEAEVRFPNSQCCECLGTVNPWKHELAIYRNSKLVWVGPIRTLTYDNAKDEIVVTAKDLFSWFDVRMIPRSPDGYYVECLDLSAIFQDVMNDAMLPDARPNIKLHMTNTGIRGSREYEPDQFQIAGDELRELSRNGVDFTMINRILFGGAIETPPDDIPLMIDEHWAVSPAVTVSGDDMTTRSIVGGGGSGADGFDVIGVYPGAVGGTGTAFDAILNPATQEFGLIERLWVEPDIDDECDESLLGGDDQESIDNAARTRWDLLSVPTVTISGGELAESAPFSLNCLIPGRRVKISLMRVCRGVVGIYRIATLAVSVTGDAESISVDLQPLGSYEAGTAAIR